jgi:hypothetical protein
MAHAAHGARRGIPRPGRSVTMTAVCLLVAGALRATLPVDAFTLAWQHSVEHTRWEEDYRVAPDALILTESRVQGFGAGMEPAPDAKLIDGAWRWRPALPALPALRLTSSPYAGDYTLCAQGRCRGLRELVPDLDVGVVTVAPCAG